MTGKKGIVYLIGAGCGDGDLITLRGWDRLGRCDAVVYDDLIAPELLEHAPETAERIYVGKRAGKPSASQEAINAVLLRQAAAGRAVARLKGGDPFVFGRGGEEILALRAAGIAYEEIPGITSAVAIPAEAGIPVTHRGVSRSFHVVTAHTADSADGLPAYFDRLAGLPGTLVFLMGLEQLPHIAERLMRAGLPDTTPAAVVSGGNSRRPGALRSTLGNVARDAAATQIGPPAVILVGETAAMDLTPPSVGPLRGCRVALTGTRAVTDKLQRELRAAGARPIVAQRSRVIPLPFQLDRDSLREDAPWLVFTSSNGVRAFFCRLSALRWDLRQLALCRFAVIGRATGETLAEYGIQADLCPAEYTGEGLAKALLSAAAPGSRILLLRSRLGSSVLPEMLVPALRVEDIPVYELADDPEAARAGQELLPSADYIVFSSGSGVELFFAAHTALPAGCRCVCIGRVTAETLRKCCGDPFLVADEISVSGIVRAIETDAGRR